MKSISFFLRSAVLSALIAGAVSAQNTPAPKWVNELPMKEGTIYAVGLVNRYYEKKAGEAAADSAAKAELASTIKTNIKSVAQSWSSTVGGGFVAELEKSIDQDVFESVRNAAILERWVDPEGLTYALAEMPLSGVSGIQNKMLDMAKDKVGGGKKDPKKIEKLEVSLKGLKDPKAYVKADKPIWISVLPEEEDAIYAIGIAEKFYFYVNGRESAKDKARGEIAATMKTQVQAALTDWFEVNEGASSYGNAQSFYEETSTQLTEVSVSGSQIVETWYDKSNKWHYALARMSMSKVIGAITDKVKDKVKDPKALKSLNDKLGKLVNRDYLKSQGGIPVWVNKLPKDEGSIFAVGIDQGKYFSETQGIEKAKADARTKLAKSVSVTVESVTKSWIEFEEKSGDVSGEPLNDYMSTLTKESTNISLEGSQIMATYVKRVKDPKTKSETVTFYSLGRLYTGGLVAKLRKKAAETMNIPAAKPNESEQDKAQRILASGRQNAMKALDRLNAALDKVNQ